MRPIVLILKLINKNKCDRGYNVHVERVNKKYQKLEEIAQVDLFLMSANVKRTKKTKKFFSLLSFTKQVESVCYSGSLVIILAKAHVLYQA